MLRNHRYQVKQGCYEQKWMTQIEGSVHPAPARSCALAVVVEDMWTRKIHPYPLSWHAWEGLTH